MSLNTGWRCCSYKFASNKLPETKQSNVVVRILRAKHSLRAPEQSILFPAARAPSSTIRPFPRTTITTRLDHYTTEHNLSLHPSHTRQSVYAHAHNIILKCYLYLFSYFSYFFFFFVYAIGVVKYFCPVVRV